MSTEPESLILPILRQMRAEIATKADLDTMATKADLERLRAEVLSEIKSETGSLRADVASDLMTMRKELTDQIVGLRRAVVDYHTSVIGHGVIISDLEARIRRVEQHLNLSRVAG